MSGSQSSASCCTSWVNHKNFTTGKELCNWYQTTSKIGWSLQITDFYRHSWSKSTKLWNFPQYCCGSFITYQYLFSIIIISINIFMPNLTHGRTAILITLYIELTRKKLFLFISFPKIFFQPLKLLMTYLLMFIKNTAHPNWLSHTYSRSYERGIKVLYISVCEN